MAKPATTQWKEMEPATVSQMAQSIVDVIEVATENEIDQHNLGKALDLLGRCQNKIGEWYDRKA